MKKLKLFLVCICGVLCTMCHPDESPGYEGRWYVKNCTNQTLILTYPYFWKDFHIFLDREIAAGDSLEVGYSQILAKGKPMLYFDQWFQDMEAEKYGDELLVKVLSENNVFLKQWNYLENNQPGKQFFGEPFWHHYDVSIERNELLTITDIWVFDILPEDIAQTEP